MKTNMSGYLRLMRLSAGFRESKIILAANDYGLFTKLSGTRMSAKKAANMTHADIRAITIVMDALVAMGFLTKENDCYGNTEVSERFLVKDKPDYKGDLLKFMNDSWNQWGNLEETIRAGDVKFGAALPDWSQGEYNKTYIWAMDNVGRERAERVSRKIDLSSVKKMLDIGGGAATYSIAFAKANPQLSSVVLDLPSTLEVAIANIAKNGLTDRIATRAESYWDAEYEPDHDMVLISQIIHGLSEAQCAELIRRSASALSPGGRLVVHDSILEEDRTAPYHAALFSAYMLATTESGRCYSFNETRRWMEDAGLTNIHGIEVDAESELIVGVRI